ncbi:hypothetical protein LIER_39593 [Lithospermum erythrorhizon]|uniref:Branched-chain amino acid aminotransferase n=1 Tax=Lithospermum erythrorhizon TaxID=34254 RepID=A0AAV3QH94_LITER
MQNDDDFHGKKVEERLIEVEELEDVEEIFCTGTAVGVAPVRSITYKGNKIEYNAEGKDMVCNKLYERLVGIQKGGFKDEKGWIVDIN